MSRPQKEWAIYKGDAFLFMGTTSECADFLQVKNHATINFYGSPAYQRRLAKRKNTDNSLILVDVSDVANERRDKHDYC